MTQFIYAVHLDNIGLHSLHHSWPSAETAISNIEYPVFRKFPAEDKEIAEHFSINGVLPINRITKTRQGYVVDVCGTKPIQSKYAVDYVTLRGAQLCSKIPPLRIARIKFVGRYARNNHKIKTEDIIKQAMEEKK